MFYVYKITNLANNKIYIGQTIRPVEDRFKRHISDAINNVLDTHFARAIRKYGENNFSIEIIDNACSQKELTEKEYYWINRLNSADPNVGYNETVSMTKCGGNTYFSKTEDEMKIISDKIRKTKIGDNNPNAVQIKCLNIFSNEELFFSTVKECQDYFQEKTHRFVTTRVTNKTKSLYKNEWAIAYLDDDYRYERKVYKTGKKVLVIDKDNNKTEFSSIRLMCRELQLQRAVVTKFIHDGVNEFTIKDYKIFVLN